MANARFKDFGKGAGSNAEPLSFRLYEEDFFCYPALQGKVLLDLVANTSSENASVMAQVVDGFFSKALMPESFIRFEALIIDPERVVPVETLGEITAWLVEEYASRPTEGSKDSSTGQ